MLSLIFGNGAYLREREEYLRPFHYAGSAFFIEEGYQSFTCSKLEKGVVCIESRIGPECFGGCLDGLLVFWSIGAKSMLDTISKLAEDVFGNIGWRLCNEENTYALASNQADNLLYFADKRFRSVFKKHMGLIEEENEFWKLHITDFREGRVEL